MASLKPSRASLADVAREAKVSVSTASRALAGQGAFSTKTRESVFEASAKLDYRPSPLARSLRTKETLVVGFVVPNTSSPFYAGVLRGAQLTLKDAGYQVMLMGSEHDLEVETDALRVLVEHQVDGILLATNALTADRCEGVPADGEPPCVLFDTVLQGIGAGSVTLENQMGMNLLVDHLAQLGHSRIAILVGAQAESTAIERLDGFRKAMARRKLTAPESLVRTCRWTREDGRLASSELLRGHPRPTAIVATSDDLALGALTACSKAGLSVPDELSVVAFDDPYFAEMLDPPLTALAYDTLEIGRRSASLLVDRMRGRETGRVDLRLPVSLVERHSSGPAPRPQDG